MARPHFCFYRIISLEFFAEWALDGVSKDFCAETETRDISAQKKFPMSKQHIVG